MKPDMTPVLSLVTARALPIPAGRRSPEAFRDGDLEVRFYAPKGRDEQTPHERDELYVVASGTGRYRVGEAVTAFGPGDLLFAAAHVPHRFEAFSQDFAVWVFFYGPSK